MDGQSAESSGSKAGGDLPGADARRLLEASEQIVLEWPEKAAQLQGIATGNLKLCENMLGF